MQRIATGFMCIFLGSIIAFSGCGGGGNKVVVDSPQDNIKVSLSLPAGWAQEGRVENNTAFFSNKENEETRGTITIWPADGKELNDWVDSQARYMGSMQETTKALGEALEQFSGEDIPEDAMGWRLISRTPKTVNDWEAVEVVEELSGKNCITYFVKKGDRICQISFFSFPEDWGENEILFRESLRSLKVK